MIRTGDIVINIRDVCGYPPGTEFMVIIGETAILPGLITIGSGAAFPVQDFEVVVPSGKRRIIKQEKSIKLSKNKRLKLASGKK